MAAITKASLREAKRNLIHRLNVLCRMGDTELSAEYVRIYPALGGTLQMPESAAETRRQLVRDAVDASIPDRWID